MIIVFEIEQFSTRALGALCVAQQSRYNAMALLKIKSDCDVNLYRYTFLMLWLRNALQVHILVFGALHTSTETRFTGSGFPIRILCGLALHTEMHCWTRFHALSRAQHSTQLRSGARLCRCKVVFRCGYSIHIGSGSKVSFGESHYHEY